MKTKSMFSDAMTFVASVAVGCTAAIAIAAAASVSESAPTLRGKPAAESVQVVRLDPVVVTLSRATFDAIRSEETALARADAARKATRG